MKRLVIALVGLAVIGAVAAFLLSEEEAGSPHEASSEVGSGAQPSEGEVSQEKRPASGLESAAFQGDASELSVASEAEPPLTLGPVLKVLDADGEPAAGVRCRIWNEQDRKFRLAKTSGWIEATALPTEAASYEALTGEDGRLDWAGWQPGACLVQLQSEASGLMHRVEVPSAAEQAKHSRTEPWTLTLKLVPVRELLVRVGNEAGRPLPGAMVALCNPEDLWVAPSMEGLATHS